MVDKNTEKKIGLNFARMLIEVEMDAVLSDRIWFKNEKGMLIEQRVLYDWKPTLCKHCKKYGHDEGECRKKKSTSQVEKEIPGSPKEKEVQEVNIQGREAGKETTTSMTEANMKTNITTHGKQNERIQNE